MNLINIYLYELNNNENLYIEPFFSSYRLNKISISNNNKIINKMIITEHLLKYALELELKKKISKIEIITTKNGKPYLVDNEIYFSISHKDNIIFIAISKNDLAIDIEKIDSKHLKVAKKLYETDANYSIARIIKDFTIKESYIKYYGLSILTNMKEIVINDKIVGPKGNLFYKTFKYNNYFITIASLSEFNSNFIKVNELYTNDLINYNKYIKISKSKEKEE